MTRNNRIAVMDIGSNSGRLVVYQPSVDGQFEILEDARIPLRLSRDLGEDATLSPEAGDRILNSLADFQAVAQGAGASRAVVVGTAAMREASNSIQIIDRIRAEIGLDVEIIDGLDEARYAFLGAVHNLAVTDGLILDIGGGSLEFTLFEKRRAVAAWSLPLGALKLSSEFFANDPPSGKEIRRLKQHVNQVFEHAGIPHLRAGDCLVGTGGTIRNLAKIDRRMRIYPINRLHGYAMEHASIKDVFSLLKSRDTNQRADIPGLNADRSDSIVAGALTVDVMMELTGAGELLVSGQGLREGILYSTIDAEPPAIQDVRRASIAALTSRFSAWDARRAERRQSLEMQLVSALEPEADDTLRELLDHAARVLDIGRSIDYYNRLSHTATIVTVANLGGFTHRDIALLTAIIQEADKRQNDLGLYSPLLYETDLEMVHRAGMLLLLADELERRYPDNGHVSIQIQQTDDAVVIRGAGASHIQSTKLMDRFTRVYGRILVFEAEG